MEQSYKEKYEDVLARLERAKNDNDVCDERFCCVIDDLIPELAESEDEKVRKEIINYFQCQSEEEPTRKEIHNKWIAWIENIPVIIDHEKREGFHLGYKACLEKQGEQKASYTTIVRTGDGGINALVTRELPTDGKQKPADTVEPKFKVGDWITNSIETVQITGYDIDYGYQVDYKGKLQHRDTDIIEKEYHLWTIQDAKDGDVLISDYEGGICIAILKSVVSSNEIEIYCHLINSELFIAQSGFSNAIWHPATKEQRTELFLKMHEAGYEWDAYTKELKKIEQKPTNWSEEDERHKNTIIRAIHGAGNITPIDGELAEEWLQSLKGRVQPKQEWSEDDKRKIDRIYSILQQAADTHAFSTSCRLIGDKECMELQDFLKSIRPQNNWKPSEEQVKAFEHFVRSIGESGYASPYENDTKLLYSLLEQLKKLKEVKI